jgi:glucuronosyltransferase
MYHKYSLFTLCPTDHPKVRVFISHGGLLGAIEAAYAGVPMVGIPIFGDQPTNMKAIADNKMGITLNYGDISKDTVLKAIRTVLDEPRYAAHCVLILLH